MMMDHRSLVQCEPQLCWYALRVKTRAELEAQADLVEAGYRPWVPRITRERIHRKCKKRILAVDIICPWRVCAMS